MSSASQVIQDGQLNPKWNKPNAALQSEHLVAAAFVPEKRAIPDKAHVQSLLQHRCFPTASEPRVITLRNRLHLEVATSPTAASTDDGSPCYPNDIHLNIGHD